MKSSRISVAALMGAQAQVSFNDNAAKFMLIALAQYPGVLRDIDPNTIRALLSALLIAPFIAFSPLAGWVVDRFSKSKVLNLALAAQGVIMLLLTAALWLESVWGAVACFLLLAVQAAVFAPAKRGILREMVDVRGLSRAVGLMEMLGVTAILTGIFAGGWLFDALTGRALHAGVVGGHAATQGALLTAVILSVLSFISWLVFQLVPATPAQSSERFAPDLFWRHGRQIAELWRDRPLRRATFGIMFFYAIGGYMLVLLIQIGAVQHAGGLGSATAASLMALFLGVGTLFGNLAAGLLSRRGVELGLAPLGGALLLASLVALARIGHQTTAFNWWLMAGGFASGFFLVPLYAFIQDTAGDHRRGRVLAAVGLMDSAAGMAANGIFLLFAGSNFLGWSPSTQFYALAVFTLAMLAYALWHLPHHTLCTLMRFGGRLFYRVRSIGWEKVPGGGALVICNHLSYVDAVVLQIASPRPMRFIAFAGFVKNPVMRFIFRAAGVIPVNANKPLKGMRLAWDAIKAGELVCVFPEGAISRTGQLMILKRGFGLIAESAKAPVVPAVIDGLWGSIYSFAGNKYLWKSPRLKPTPVTVVFGTPIPPEKVTLGSARQALLDLGEIAFQERPVLRRHLGREAIRALAKHPRHIAVIDRTMGRQELSAGRLLAAAAVLARRLRATLPGEKRIGIVLPPGIGANIANLAVSCAGKVPVNLNFTAGRAAVEASLKLGEIRTVITADAMKPKIPTFPFPAHTLDLKAELEAAGGRRAIVPWLVAAYVLPNQWVANLMGLPRTGDNEEAALLFTSGSSGEPKGVILTHRNILANCAQISSLSILPESASMLGCLPIFHSFGFTVSLWYPLLRGCMVVTVPSPLDTRKIVEAIQLEQATVLIGAPTFIRPFLKKATKEELKTLQLVVTGAEKLPMDLYESFLQQFGIEILQGYGLTETTPAASINQYHPPITTTTAEHQEGKRTGSVGRLLPGSTARIVDPETGAELPATSTGMLWLKGPHVFPGYLKDEQKTTEALKGRWFVTGDLGRFDEDGFMFIEGRLSRFSKIGGEMVPHGTIEQRLIAAFEWDQTDGPVAVVTGIPDPSKGEALVLLTTKEVSVADLRTKLLEAGFANLWVPKVICKVDAIPVLGSGKTDLKACRTLAIELAAAQAVNG